MKSSNEDQKKEEGIVIEHENEGIKIYITIDNKKILLITVQMQE